MKTITLKKQLLLVALIFFCGVAPSFADDDTSMTLNVEAGTLSSLIPASKMYKITELKLSGELNVEDLKVIRRMGACRKSIGDKWYDGHLQHLDISDAEFVGDGIFVYYSKTSYGPCNFTDREYLFAGMKSLQTIELPNSMKEIDGSLFYECSNLVSLTLPSELTTIGVHSLGGCPNLMSIKIDKNNPYYCSDGAILFNKDKSKIVLAKKTLDAYSIPSSVTQIQSWAFAGCNSLIYLILPSGLTQIEDGTFYGCRFKSLSLPSSVTQIGSSAFRACTNLTSITLPSGVTQIDYEAFRDCTSLTSITLPSGVTQIGNYAFYNCSKLKYITLPSGLTQIGNGAFYQCESLTSITLPSGVTQIGRSAFSWCKSLTSITLPSSVTQIGNYAFSHCENLTSITLPSGLEQIDNELFANCNELRTLRLPSSLTEIGDSAFGSCKNISSVYAFMAVPPLLDNSIFSDSTTKNVTLYVPKGSYVYYRIADFWDEFTKIKEFDAIAADIENTHSADSAKELTRYAVNGQRLATPAKGLNIVRYSDGTVKKVMEK